MRSIERVTMEYFKLFEFFPNCSLPEKIQVLESSVMSSKLVKLFTILNELRDKLGMPIRINSGFRDIKHNSLVIGSSPTSQHLVMEALDITCPDNDRLLEIISNSNYFGQVIVYNTFIHVALPCKRYPNQIITYKEYI